MAKSCARCGADAAYVNFQGPTYAEAEDRSTLYGAISLENEGFTDLGRRLRYVNAANERNVAAFRSFERAGSKGLDLARSLQAQVSCVSTW